MIMEDGPRSSPAGSSRISGRQLFWLLCASLGAPVLITLAIAAWDFVEAQRIWAIIDANAGYTCLSPGSIAIGDSHGSDDLVCGRPVFRYQVVKVSIGFNVGGENVDFSQPLQPGEQHPLA